MLPLSQTVSLHEIGKALEAAERLLIISHTGPDGDTVGSSAALAYIAKAMGCEVKWVSPDPMAQRLSFLMPEEFLFEYTEGCEDDFDLICSVDVASPAQLGSLEHLAGKIGFMIDHHETGEPYAPCFVDPHASAAGEIIFRLYALLKEQGKIGAMPEVSRAVYAAIVSDTGSFKFSNVTPETHIIAAELVREINGATDGGMNTDELCRTLFGRRTLRDIKAQGLAIKNLRVFADGELGAVLLPAEDVLAEGLDETDLGASVEVPRSLDGVKIAISVRQKLDDRGTFKVSSRSNCEISVSDICALFGGGGHPKAAGCTVHAESPEAALEAAVRAFSAPLVAEA